MNRSQNEDAVTVALLLASAAALGATDSAANTRERSRADISRTLVSVAALTDETERALEAAYLAGFDPTADTPHVWLGVRLANAVHLGAFDGAADRPRSIPEAHAAAGAEPGEVPPGWAAALERAYDLGLEIGATGRA